MADPAAGLSTGEAGGLFAGAVALLAVLGKGAAWLINWGDARAQSRAAKLQLWHDELKERETALDAQINGRLAALELQVKDLTATAEKWRTAFHLVAAEQLQRNPHSAALLQAQKILAEIFPWHLEDSAIPQEMQGALDRMP